MTSRRILFVFSAVCIGGAFATPIAAQAPSSPDSSQAAPSSVAPAVVGIAALLAPEAGMLIGGAIGGRTGAIVGTGAGLAIGAAIAVAGARHHPPARPGQPLCLVPGDPGTPQQIIPGSPGSPAIGDSPAIPATPHIILPGTPSTPDRWELCR